MSLQAYQVRGLDGSGRSPTSNDPSLSDCTSDLQVKQTVPRFVLQAVTNSSGTEWTCLGRRTGRAGRQVPDDALDVRCVFGRHGDAGVRDTRVELQRGRVWSAAAEDEYRRQHQVFTRSSYCSVAALPRSRSCRLSSGDHGSVKVHKG